MTTISIRQMAQIKNTAKSVAADVVKKEKLAAKIMDLGNEYKEVSAKIEDWQAPIKRMANGLTTEDLVVRVVTPYLNEDGTQKMDKDGHPLTITKYVPNEKKLQFDEKKRVYVVIEETVEAPEAVAPAEEAHEVMPTDEMPFGVEM